MDVPFTQQSLFLDLISPHLLQRGVYGRIDNIKTVTCVCKSWQNWIYSDCGPYLLVNREFTPDFKHGKINGLNKRITLFYESIFKRVKLYDPSIDPQTSWISALSSDTINEKKITLLEFVTKRALKGTPQLTLFKSMIDHQIKILTPQLRQLYVSSFFFIFQNAFQDCFVHCKEMAAYILHKDPKAINYLDNQGKGFLHYYWHMSDPDGEILNWYIENGGNVDLLSWDRKKPLEEFFDNIKKNYTHKLNSINLIKHSNLDSNESLLHPLLKANIIDDTIHEAIAKAILDKDPNQINLVDQDGRYPLCVAIVHNKAGVKSALISYTNKEWMQDHIAVVLDAFIRFFEIQTTAKWSKDSLDIKTQIIPNFTIGNEHTHTLLLNKFIYMMSTWFDQTEILEFLGRSDDRGNTFYHKLAASNAYILNLIFMRFDQTRNFQEQRNIRNESVVDLQRKNINTITLVNACHTAQKDSIKETTSQPIVLNVKDKEGNSLIHLLVYYCILKPDRVDDYYKIIELLVEKGLNPNLLNHEGHTPLHYVDNLRCYNLYRRLEDLGAIDK